VALEKTEYLNKIEEMLNDTETYKKINKDPTKRLTNKEVLTVRRRRGTLLTTHIMRFIVAMGIYHGLMGYLRATNQVSHSE